MKSSLPKASSLPAVSPSLRSAAERAPVQRAVAAPNRTGLPDNLKAGVESLSGMSLDHVRVHRNSAKPAQLNAHAYAQGSDIHLAPGQEKHLPHEAWHVVQQAQGRVSPTTYLQRVAINDNPHLEREADVMGARALGAGTAPARTPPNTSPEGSPVGGTGSLRGLRGGPMARPPGQAPIQRIMIGQVRMTPDEAYNVLTRYFPSGVAPPEAWKNAMMFSLERLEYKEESFQNVADFREQFWGRVESMRRHLVAQQRAANGDAEEVAHATNGEAAVGHAPTLLDAFDLLRATAAGGYRITQTSDPWVNPHSTDGTVNMEFDLLHGNAFLTFEIHVHPQVQGLSHDALHMKVRGDRRGGYLITRNVYDLIGTTPEVLKARAKACGESAGWSYRDGTARKTGVG